MALYLFQVWHQIFVQRHENMMVYLDLMLLLFVKNTVTQNLKLCLYQNMKLEIYRMTDVLIIGCLLHSLNFLKIWRKTNETIMAKENNRRN